MICSNPACEHSGIDQPPENFPPRKRRCRSCCRKAYKAWREKNADKDKAYRKWIPDDDPEDDLKPIRGEADWTRITR